MKKLLFTSIMFAAVSALFLGQPKTASASPAYGSIGFGSRYSSYSPGHSSYSNYGGYGNRYNSGYGRGYGSRYNNGYGHGYNSGYNNRYRSGYGRRRNSRGWNIQFGLH